MMTRAEKMTGKSKHTLAFYTLLYICFFLMSSVIVNKNDDFVFMKGIEQFGSFTGWASFFVNNWGGRIIPQGILVLLLQLPGFVFTAVDAAMWVILLIYACRICDFGKRFDHRIETVLLAIGIFTLIPAAVLTGAVFWKCANIKYLWGTAGILVAIYPLVCQARNSSYTRKDLILAWIACIYTASFEQGAAFMSGALILLFLFNSFVKKHFDKHMMILTAAGIILTAFFYKLPGNALRSQIEVYGQMPKYDMYSAPDKLLWGLWYAVENTEQFMPLVFLALSGIVAYCAFRYRKEDKIFRLIGIVLFVYFGLCWIVRTGSVISGNAHPLGFIYTMITVDNVTFGLNLREALCETIHIAMYALLGASLLYLRPGKTNILPFITFFGGLATMTAIGFSPTIYASGARPQFLGDFFLLCTVFVSVCDAAEGSDFNYTVVTKNVNGEDVQYNEVTDHPGQEYNVHGR